MNIGAGIKHLLKEKDISQVMLASMIGRTPVFVNKILKKETIDTGVLESIASVLEVPVTYFFDDKAVLPKSVTSDSVSKNCQSCKEMSKIIDMQQDMIAVLKKYNQFLENSNNKIINK